MNKLLLIHPTSRTHAAGFGSTKSWGMPPLALGYVAALTPPTWEIKIVDEYVEQINWSEPVQLVGITSYTVNITRAYELAARFRERGISVVLGGIHASMVPAEAAQYVDAVVVGEAESVWPDVITDFERNALKKTYHGERRGLEGLPFPRRDLMSDRYEMDVIQTSRGCPFNCEFCSVTAFNGAGYRMRPAEEVVAELATLKKKLVYFVDDSLFGARGAGHERIAHVCREMVAQNRRKIWMAQASIDVADNADLLSLAHRSGCRSLFLGLESAEMASLREVGKGPNIPLGIAGMRRSIRAIGAHGICVVGSFVLGFDHDGRDIFRKTLEMTREVDAVQYQLLTPFPGTRLAKRIADDGRLLYGDFPGDWERYDMDHLVMKTAGLDAVDLALGREYLIERTLSPGAIAVKALKTLWRSRSLVATLFAINLNRDSAAIFAAQKRASLGEA